MLFLIIMFYFCTFQHRWLMNITGGRGLNDFALLLVLSCMILLPQILSYKLPWDRIAKINSLIIVSCLWGTLSNFYHEKGYDNIRGQTIYIFTPLILYLCMLSFRKYRYNENIKLTLKILLIVAVIFCLYISFVVYVTGGNAEELHKYGHSELFEFHGRNMVRWSMPGRSSTNFAPLLVPLVFVGLYLGKSSRRWSRCFYLCAAGFILFVVCSSISRGAFLMLAGAAIYLCFNGWLRTKKMREIFMLFFLALAITLCFNSTIVLRTLATFKKLPVLSSIDILNDVSIGSIEGKDPRVYAMHDTAKHIFDKPILGHGHTNFITSQKLRIKEYSHNNYLKILAVSGFPRFIFYILFLFSLFCMAHKTAQKLPANDPEKDLGLILCAGMVSFLIYLNLAPAEFSFIWIWFGFVAIWSRNVSINSRKVYSTAILS